MQNSELVNFAARFLPQSIFIKLRRKYPFCKYNYHSAVKVRRANRGRGVGDLMATCKHCGALVEMDHTRQWRIVQVGLFAATDNAEGDALLGWGQQAAIPLKAEETAPELIVQPELDGREFVDEDFQQQ
ncbi:hypothetical protein [Novosphingobium sp.]|uniref:hypothetical protein n=1 Tax=Novosphingobium sp. TaxID=1874826 RepID=UPI00263545ED|nr:hypothetical protein [Novosphingobium sp.]